MTTEHKERRFAAAILLLKNEILDLKEREDGYNNRILHAAGNEKYIRVATMAKENVRQWISEFEDAMQFLENQGNISPTSDTITTTH
jgi:hypothetical protein